MHKFHRQTVAEKYDLKEILYALRSLYDALKHQKEIEYEVRGLRRAMILLRKNLPRIPKDGHCPNCGHEVDNFYCPECGQQIFYNNKRRPIDDLRRSTKYNHRSAEWYGLLQRREVDEYIRIMGIDWVLEKLSYAERDADPIDKKGIKDLYLEGTDERNTTDII